MTCSTSQGALATSGGNIKLILEPAPFTLDIGVTPANLAGQAQVRIAASTALSGMPQVQLFQSGSVTPVVVLPVFAVGANVYTGTFNLDPALPQSGSVEVIAQDAAGHSLQLFSAFSLSQVTADEDVTIYSADGQVELYLPAGSLSASERLSIVPDSSAGAPPEDWVIVSGPYSIQAGSGVTLNNNVALTLRYLDTGGSLSRVDLATVQVYRWDTATSRWIGLSSNIFGDHNAVAASISTFGTYAAMAQRQYLVYLPVVLRNY